LVVVFINPQDPESSTVIDGRILVVPLSGILDPLEELNVNLKPMPGHGLFVAFPALLVPLVALIIRKPIHMELIEDPPDP